MKLIPNFTHTPGAHCGSTAMRDLLRYIGLDVSEAMCLGLGSGLGFLYFRNPRGDSPSRLFFGRTVNFEREACAHLAVDFEEGADDDAERAWQTVKNFVNRDIPVLLHLELSQLPYWNTRTPFPGHRAILAGYDDARQIAFLADTHFPGLQQVSYDALRAARATKIPPLPLHNEWLAIKSSVIASEAKQSPMHSLGIASQTPLAMTLQNAVRAALRDNARAMVMDRAPHFGVMGMETLAEDFETWGDAPDWVVCTRFGFQNIEVRGTGGGFFRALYAQFLRDANFPELGATMDEIANEWSAFARLLKQIADEKNRARLGEASRAIRRLAMREENFWGRVLDTTS
ncbi:MAG: DUF4872 domain-containing protein [Chloroflexi bacterium]|nr:DUF4872 domain-containing protein [Chloroflexota bacterium]